MRTFHAISIACALFLQTTESMAQGRSGENKGAGQGTAGKSRAQEALDSRRSLFSRAADRVRSTPASIAAEQAKDPLTRPESAQRRQAQDRTIQRQDFRSREFTENSVDRRASFARKGPADRASFERKAPNWSRNDLRNTRPDDAAGASHGAPADLADRQLAKRLADIDHLRDVAVKNGNERQLEQADRLEELARRQYDRSTTGAKLHANEIFKPAGHEEPQPGSTPEGRTMSRAAAEPPMTTTPPASRTAKLKKFFSFGFLRRGFRGRQTGETE